VEVEVELELEVEVEVEVEVELEVEVEVEVEVEWQRGNNLAAQSFLKHIRRNLNERIRLLNYEYNMVEIFIL
jgi:hypothetical protein